MDLASSTVMTPSLPTFSIASAISSPIVGSLFAEIVPTLGNLFLVLAGLAHFLQLRHDGLDRLIDAPFDIHRIAHRR